MKTSTKKILSTIIFITVITFSVNAQTNVSGGIYSNTTWTLANSPYIVTGDVVVFPGVTLTIEPGVIVKLDSAVTLEFRQADLFALGTISDSITFTSSVNVSTPTYYSNWGQVYLNGVISTHNMHLFNYCNFRFISTGLNFSSSTTYDTLIIKNSNFNNNKNGLEGSNNSYLFVDSCNFKFNRRYGYSGGSLGNGVFNNCEFTNDSIGVTTGQYVTMTNCKINSNQIGLNQTHNCHLINCIIRNNQWGFFNSSGENVLSGCQLDSNLNEGIRMSDNDSLFNCSVTFNNIGIADHGLNQENIVTHCTIENNAIGLHIEGLFDKVYCNKICNNISYDFYYNQTPNFNATNNYWCSSDSATIRSHIYDGYTNISLGLVYITPFDTIGCYATTGIPTYEVPPLSFSFYPNPSSDYITIELPVNSPIAEIKVFNLTGQLMNHPFSAKQKMSMDISDLPGGVYILEVAGSENIGRQKFIKQ